MNQHFYINLEHRKERDLITKQELKKLGIKKPNRFNAITHEIPLVGCARSHIACLEKAKELDGIMLLSLRMILRLKVKIQSYLNSINLLNMILMYCILDVGII